MLLEEMNQQPAIRMKNSAVLLCNSLRNEALLELLKGAVLCEEVLLNPQDGSVGEKSEAVLCFSVRP